MKVIEARNVNDAFESGLAFIRAWGVKRDSRNGVVLVAPTPVTTVYARPDERVLFSPERDANPFFHLVEALWMLAGREDLATLVPFASNMKNFSDDGGKTQPGAYGKRWRAWFEKDQLLWAINRLKADTNDRRVIIQMYDARFDQQRADTGGKDIPCNIVAAPWIDVEGKLAMSIFCRSNDIIWGAYGANAVHFSVMQEYIAAGIGIPMGAMYQVSNNYHMYLKTAVEPKSFTAARYKMNHVRPMSMFEDLTFPTILSNVPERNLRMFDEDLTIFFDEPSAVGLRSAFLRQVACPMVLAHKAWRDKKDTLRFAKAQEILVQCRASDWRVAGAEWMMRRQVAFQMKDVQPEDKE